MIYFFINILMYLVMELLLAIYFYHKITITSFIIVLFNMNVYFFFIYKNINFIYGLLFLIISLILYYFINLLIKENKEVLLIQKGNINFHEVITNYSYQKLINYLKHHKVKLDEVDYCLKRGNRITIIRDNKLIK